MALIITTHLWGGDKYSQGDVKKLKAGLQRHLKQPFRFICATDSIQTSDDSLIEDRALTKVKGCFCRLRMFDPHWQFMQEIYPGDRVVSLDLDLIVTGELDGLFDTDAEFSILTGINSTNPNPMNGSVWMFRAGTRPDVWRDFSLEAAARVPFHAFPDDQGWFWHKFKEWNAWGPQTGIYGFKKVGWPEGDDLPDNARIVAFPGWRSPWKFTHLPWVRKHWDQ